MQKMQIYRQDLTDVVDILKEIFKRKLKGTPENRE